MLILEKLWREEEEREHLGTHPDFFNIQNCSKKIKSVNLKNVLELCFLSSILGFYCYNNTNLIY